ncbi:MAG: HNH endonuclease [Pyrinomonadaceae bacterium]
MSRHISDSVRKIVEDRANRRCEYCRISMDDTYFGGEVDHIRSLKHGGKTEIENLALACMPCNRNKGTDLGSVPAGSEDIVAFFDPRKDRWEEHFKLGTEAEIVALTRTGEVTANIFRFNDPERLVERRGLVELGRYN